MKPFSATVVSAQKTDTVEATEQVEKTKNCVRI